MTKGSKPPTATATKSKVRFNKQAANTNDNKFVLNDKLVQLTCASEIEAEW
jgi:hypothetical protein